MPTFDFQCPNCGFTTEYFVQPRTFPRLFCKCNTLMVKQPSAPAVHFKGNGFYENDYKKKN